MQLTRPQRIALFYGIACAGAWSLVLMLAASGRGIEGGAGRAVLVLHGFSVALAALIVQGPILRGGFVEPLGLKLQPNVFWLWALALPMITVLVAMLVAALIPDAEPVGTAARYLEIKRAQVLATDPSQIEAFDKLVAEHPPSDPPWLWLVLQALPLGLTFNAVLGLVEELGWRGFLLHQLAGGFWRRALLTGVFWGLFMVPVVTQGHLFPGDPILGAVLVVVFSIALSPMLLWIRLRADSVIAPALFRGMIFGLTNVGYDLVHSDYRWLQPPYGITGIVAALLVTAALALYESRLPAERRVIGAPVADG